jgi:hypothetical protein
MKKAVSTAPLEVLETKCKTNCKSSRRYASFKGERLNRNFFSLYGKKPKEK